MKKILVVGSGGREHSLCWAVNRSHPDSVLYCTPGNGGTTDIAKNISIRADQVSDLCAFCESEAIDFVIVGPEVPLTLGLGDELRVRGIPVFGPDQDAARLEGSKAFAKTFMHQNSIPTAPFEIFTDFDAAVSYLDHRETYPIVLKASGLAAGKGVVITRDRHEATTALHDWFIEKKLGDSGETVVIEDCLRGEEVSLFVVTDGTSFQVLPPVQDHKRLLDGDLGPNTGGMGTCAPSTAIDDEWIDRIITRIVQPTLNGLIEGGMQYRGVLFLGLMIDHDEVNLLEYNVRFGDPETQAMLPLLKVDVAELLLATANGELRSLQNRMGWQPNRWQSLANPGASLCVVMAARGYPDAPKTNLPIQFPEGYPEGIFCFHAGTKRIGDESVVSGGRVLNVVGMAPSIEEARTLSYEATHSIQFEGKQYRTDIGNRMLPASDRSTHNRLVVLGSASGMPSADRSCSSYWLEVEGNGYLIDCGDGTATQLCKYGIDTSKLRAVFISHTHPDHVSGLPMLIQMLSLQLRIDPLPIYMPRDKISSFTEYYRNLYLDPTQINCKYHLLPLTTDGYSDQHFKIQPFPTSHLSKNRMWYEQLGIGCISQGFRITIGDRVIVYPSDLPSLSDCEPYCTDAHLLLIEATHIQPRDTAKLAAKNSIPRVLLTHLPVEESNLLPEWQALGIEYHIPFWAIASDGMIVSI